MNLISDILDLSKIESGTVSVDAEEIFFTSFWTWWRARSATRPRTDGSPSRCIPTRISCRSLVTDSKRFQQVLKNLLSNAFKFTEQGGVRLSVSAAVGRLE